MTTRSASHRMTRNAELVAKAMEPHLLVNHRRRQGAFDQASARAFVSTRFFDSDIFAEVNWPLAAELMNRRTAP